MQYFLSTNIMDEDGNIIATPEDRELSAEEVIEVLVKKLGSPEAVVTKILPKTVPFTRLKKNGGGPKEKPQSAKKTEEEGTPLRKKIWQLKDGGMKPKEIAKETGEAIGNVYYYLKKRPGLVTSPTPEKEGEREIDLPAEKLTLEQFESVRDMSRSGMSSGAIKMSTGYDIDEIRKIINCDFYSDYLKEK